MLLLRLCPATIGWPDILHQGFGCKVDDRQEDVRVEYVRHYLKELWFVLAGRLLSINAQYEAIFFVVPTEAQGALDGDGLQIGIY